jgi:hypothetical protein
MLFKLTWMDTLFQGKLSSDHPAASLGRPVILNQANLAFSASEVEFVVPDDEAQADKLRLAGYQTHSPLSMVLGGGATDPGK